MAKQIKVVKCPQCGSTQKTELKPDFYQCNNCGTKYFLDDDTVFVNVRHNINRRDTNINTPGTSSSNNSPSRSGWLIAVFFLLIFLGIMIFREVSKRNGETAGDSDSGYRASMVESKFIEDIETSNPQLFVIEKRRYGQSYSSDRRSDYYAVYVDLLTKKKLREIKIKDVDERSNTHTYFSLEDFYDGWYLGIEEREMSYDIYKIDPKQYTMESIIPFLTENFTELSAGIAKIKFEHYIDAIEILTNDGKEYLYSSYSNKLYPDDRKVGADTDIPVYTRYYYDFTTKDHYCSKHPKAIQLLQTKAISQNKILRTYRFEWDHYCKLDAMWFNGKLTYVKDVTPGRNYFGGDGNAQDQSKPSVVYSDDSNLIVKVKASANPNASFNLQSIDIDSGDIRWTIDLESKEIKIKDFAVYKDGYVICIGEGRNAANPRFYRIDKNGSMEDLGFTRWDRGY